jgi:hypothetical protein
MKTFLSLLLVLNISTGVLLATPAVETRENKVIITVDNQEVTIDLENGGTVTGFKFDGTQLLERKVGQERLCIVRIFKPQLTHFTTK